MITYDTYIAFASFSYSRRMAGVKFEELYKWLEDIDLEEYYENFVDLGVKKIKHLADVTDVHFKILGFKELEIIRFEKKRSSAENAVTSKQNASVPTVSVKMPSLAFGQKTRPVSEKELIKNCKELYYEEPRNWKQRESNEFVLAMCSSASWRFKNNRQLFDWARQERDDRLSAALIFASEDELADESQYFKRQSLTCNIKSLDKDFDDVRPIINGTKPMNKMKRGRVILYNDEVEQLVKTAEETKLKIEEKHKRALKREGHKEEEEFWLKLLHRANTVQADLDAKYIKIKDLVEKMESEYGPSAAASTSARKKKITERRAVKRLKGSRPRKDTIDMYLNINSKRSMGSSKQQFAKVVIACKERFMYL